MDSQLLQKMTTIMHRRMANLPIRLRPFTSEHDPLPRTLLLTGPRGVGKSTFLLHHARKRHMLYLSADNPLVAAESLYDMASFLFMQGYEGIIIDEVHFAKNWSTDLKALYDDFPQQSIWASDSSSLVLRHGIGDLSRRYVPITMPLLSFREFLYLETGISYPVFNPFFDDLSSLPVEPTSKILSLFKTYRTQGTRPFYQEGAFSERSLALLDKILYSDVPFFLPRITENNFRLMKAIVATLGKAAIPRLEVSSLCNDWKIGADKLYTLLEIMESVGVIRIIRKQGDTKQKTAGAKMFFADPTLYAIMGSNPGTEREALVAAMIEESGNGIAASRSEPQGDFIVTFANGTSHLIEVGGARKRRKKADFVIRDDTDYPTDTGIPLWLLGMMW